MNVRTRLTGNLNLSSETGNIYLNTSSINRFRVDPSGNIYSYGNFDVSGNIKALGKITTNSLDVSGNIKALGKITTNSLDVSGNINLQNLSNPNNTTISITSEPSSYNSKLILGSGYIGSNPVNSFTDISTCQIIAKRNNLYIDAAVGKTININSEANGNVISYGTWSHNGNFETNDVSLNTLYVIKEIVSSKLYTSNSTSKSLIQFQTKLGANSLYYYNIDLDKYYKTGQTINGKTYKIFNLTSWAEDGFSIINKCTVYISSQSPGIKYIMNQDNWGAYLSNGNQSGWQIDNSTRYMTFVTATQKNIITILENLL
jgi:cytoskeletal protein CcmA (bactofilin family)